MPGGFHPFHAGHAALYQSAIKAFPGAEVYVAATNDTKTRPFPFAIKEKLAKLAGVESGHFIQVKSPFQPREITDKFNPEQDVVIFVRSDKDRNESPKPGGMKKDGSPAYFQPWTGKNVQPFGKQAYIAYLPTVEFGPGITSATEIRNAWPRLDDRRKTAMVMSLYPVTQKNPKLAANVVKMLDMGMGEQQGVAETINSAILNKKFKHKQVIGDYTYTATSEDFEGSPLLWIKAYHGNKEIGHILFEIIVRSPGGKRKPSADYIESGGTEVDPAYRDKGVASTMYAYAKMLGNDIQASYNQTSQGKAMWKAWEKAGNAKHLVGTSMESTVKINEFAPLGGDDREPDEEEILRQLAAQWWNGTEQQMKKAQQTLQAMGWDIGQDESGDDDAGVFVIRVGDENGDSYIAFNHSDLSLDEGPIVQRIIRPNKVNVYVRHTAGKPALLVATDVPYAILDKYVDKVIQKYPQFKQTDFSFKSSDKVTENMGLPYPDTYEEENQIRKDGPMRITAMTSESNLSESTDYLEEK